MYRAIPSANKILTSKWQNKQQSIHMKNLQQIKGTVDMQAPPRFQHLKKKMKKTQMLEERYTEIERENRILLEKMTNILQKQRGTLYTANSAGYVGAGTSQGQQRSYLMSQTGADMTLQPVSTPGNQPRRSLNREARKRELMKITKENQMILKRLQDKNASYNVQKWQKDEVSRTKVLRNICEYPLQIGDHQIVSGLAQPDFIITKKNKNKSNSTGAGFYKKKGFTTNSQLQQQQFGNQIIKKETLYTGEHDLGNGIYSIEMLISQTDDLVISAQHLELPDSFIIEIEAGKVDHLFNEFQNDFELMATHLKIMNKRMVLLNPKFLSKQEEEQVAQMQQENMQQEDQLPIEEGQIQDAGEQEIVGEQEIQQQEEPNEGQLQEEEIVDPVVPAAAADADLDATVGAKQSDKIQAAEAEQIQETEVQSPPTKKVEGEKAIMVEKEAAVAETAVANEVKK